MLMQMTTEGPVGREDRIQFCSCYCSCVLFKGFRHRNRESYSLLIIIDIKRPNWKEIDETSFVCFCWFARPGSS